MTVDEFVAHLRACAKATPWPGVRDCYTRAAGIIEGDRAALRNIAHDDLAMCDSCDAYQEIARKRLEAEV